MDRGARGATVHGVIAKSKAGLECLLLSAFFNFHNQDAASIWCLIGLSDCVLSAV